MAPQPIRPEIVIDADSLDVLQQVIRRPDGVRFVGSAPRRRVLPAIGPDGAVQAPLARLEALCGAFLSHLERRVFPGGCFFVSAAAEFDTHPGPVKEAVAAFLRGWLGTLQELAARAQQQGDLRVAEDPAQLAFELDAYLLMANMTYLLHNDPVTLQRARAAIEDRITRARRPSA